MSQLLSEGDFDGVEFDSFCHEFFHRNCEEREAYNEPLLSFEEYLEKNRSFLVEEYNNQNKQQLLF